MKPSRYFKLGLFVLIGVGLIAGTVIALGAGRLLQKHVPPKRFSTNPSTGWKSARQ